MKLNIFLVLIMGFVLVVILGACSSQGTTQAAPPPASSSSSAPAVSSLDGPTLLQDRCTVCHSMDRIVNAHHTQDEWSATVARMVGKGANLSQTEQDFLVNYLAQTYK